MTDYLKRLAVATVECSACGGTGKQPLMPRLTRPCPGRFWHEEVSKWPETRRKKTGCPDCRGSGQVLVSDAEAPVALLDYCDTHDYVVIFWPKSGRDAHPGAYGAVSIEREEDGRGFDGSTLAEAVAKALGLVAA